MTARTPFCRCLSQRRLESDDGGSATFLSQQAFRFCGGEAGRASRSLVPEERTGFGPRRPWLSVLAGRRSACGDSTRAAAVSPLKWRPKGPWFARGCWPAMVGADGETLAGHVPGAGVVGSRVARTPPRSSATLAVCGSGGFSRVCRSAPKAWPAARGEVGRALQRSR